MKPTETDRCIATKYAAISPERSLPVNARFSIRRAMRLLPVVLLVACAANPVAERTDPKTAGLPDLPLMKTFSTLHPVAPGRSNRELAEDFLELSFQMESGALLTHFTRFEGPITLRVTGPQPTTLQRDLDLLLARLGREAGISITQVTGNQPASITVEVITRSQLRRLVPHAACFVAPNVSGWQEYKADRTRRRTDWRHLARREKVSVFLPGDVSPQDIRDCLHEEISQALGPLNDLYRLPDSIFNDDNFHTVLTGFDMLMLRTYYAPQLRNGMTRTQVSVLLPAILRRLNPQGEALPTRSAQPSPRSWRADMAVVLAPETRRAPRQKAIERVIERSAHWNDVRAGFALSIRGRFWAPENPDRSYASFHAACRLFSLRPETRLHAAHIAAHLSVFALAAGEPRRALDLVDASIGAAFRAENAALLSTLLLYRAEALRALGRAGQADTVRQEALGWARYGIGSDDDVRAHEREIAAVARRYACRTIGCSAGG